MRILLGTNIIIAGLLSRTGSPGQLVQKGLDAAFELATSQMQLDESQRALGYESLGADSPKLASLQWTVGSFGAQSWRAQDGYGLWQLGARRDARPPDTPAC